MVKNANKFLFQRSYLELVINHVEDPELTEMYLHDELLASQLKKYIKYLLQDGIKRMNK